MCITVKYHYHGIYMVAQEYHGSIQNHCTCPKNSNGSSNTRVLFAKSNVSEAATATQGNFDLKRLLTSRLTRLLTNNWSGLSPSFPNEQLYSLVSHQNSVLSASAAMMLCSGLSHTSSRCAQNTAGSHCASQPRRRSRNRRSSGSSSLPPGAGNQASRPAEDTESRLLAILTCPALFVCVDDEGWSGGEARQGLLEKAETQRILQALTVTCSVFTAPLGDICWLHHKHTLTQLHLTFIWFNKIWFICIDIYINN